MNTQKIKGAATSTPQAGEVYRVRTILQHNLILRVRADGIGLERFELAAIEYFDDKIVIRRMRDVDLSYAVNTEFEAGKSIRQLCKLFNLSSEEVQEHLRA